jgi:hypothetical protein
MGSSCGGSIQRNWHAAGVPRRQHAPSDSHALDILDAVRPGATLGREPEELVEADDLGLGTGLTRPCGPAVPEVFRAVRDRLR